MEADSFDRLDRTIQFAMTWLEMSREAAHGGAGWEFGTCLWSPTIRDGGGRWAYWELMRRVREGDVVLHLRGKRDQRFVGHSIADADCYTTTRRPPDPGTWDHAESFYRVPLRDYCAVEKPVTLSEVFAIKAEQLVQYHSAHSPVGRPNGRYLFYVPQAGRLQCQNGAYLSEVDSTLASILFEIHVATDSDEPEADALNTGVGIATLKTRIGQSAFSNAVRKNYGHKCCFPNCEICDERLLVAGHVARWADVPSLRGQLSNGICMCLMHDKAFELGIFTLDSQLRIQQIPERSATVDWAKENILPFVGQTILIPSVAPSIEVLQYHWSRIGFTPRIEETS